MARQILTDNNQKEKSKAKNKKAIGGSISHQGTEIYTHEGRIKTVDKWLIRVFLGTFEGKKRHKSVVFRGTWQEAQEELIKLKGCVRNGFDPFADRHSMEELIERYISTEFEKLSPVTRNGKISVFEKHLKTNFAGPLKNITILTVQNFVKELISKGYASNTIYHIISECKLILNYAKGIGWVKTNPFCGVKLPRKEAQREIKALTIEEINRVLNNSKENLESILIRLALITGARPSEYLALKWEDIDLTACKIQIRRTAYFQKGKGMLTKDSAKTLGSKRVITIDKETAKLLTLFKFKNGKRNSDFIFTTKTGKLFTPCTIGNILKSYLAKLGINRDFCLYWLRHSCATYLLSQGLPVKDVSARLGHKSAFMTLNVYSHSLESNQTRAASFFESGYLRKQLIC